MTDKSALALEAAKRLLAYIGSPRVKLTFASDAEIVARCLLSLSEERKRLREAVTEALLRGSFSNDMRDTLRAALKEPSNG